MKTEIISFIVMEMCCVNARWEIAEGNFGRVGVQLVFSVDGTAGRYERSILSCSFYLLPMSFGLRKDSRPSDSGIRQDGQRSGGTESGRTLPGLRRRVCWWTRSIFGRISSRYWYYMIVITVPDQFSKITY